jgi:hypothetical protein
VDRIHYGEFESGMLPSLGTVHGRLVIQQSSGPVAPSRSACAEDAVARRSHHRIDNSNREEANEPDIMLATPGNEPGRA